MFVVTMNATEKEEEMERAHAAGKKSGGSKPGRKSWSTLTSAHDMEGETSFTEHVYTVHPGKECIVGLRCFKFARGSFAQHSATLKIGPYGN